MSYVRLPDGTIEVLNHFVEVPGTNEVQIGNEFSLAEKVDEGRRILSGYKDYYTR